MFCRSQKASKWVKLLKKTRKKSTQPDNISLLGLGEQTFLRNFLTSVQNLLKFSKKKSCSGILYEIYRTYYKTSRFSFLRIKSWTILYETFKSFVENVLPYA